MLSNLVNYIERGARRLIDQITLSLVIQNISQNFSWVYHSPFMFFSHDIDTWL